MNEAIRSKTSFICDMDGVIYHGNKILPGAKEFINWLQQEKKRFLFLTNSSERSPRELTEKLSRMGLDISEEHFYTSALATAAFLASQKERGSAYVIGEAGLINALYDVGYAMNNVNPDYVVVGETRSYNFEKIEQAINLVLGGARLIGANSDLTGPTEHGIIPATKALVAPIELATGRTAYFVGKPNPIIMRSAMKQLNADPAGTLIIGDRMDTDILAGIESGIDTVLVLSGISTRETVEQYAYRPAYIMQGLSEML
ncbi:MAG: HAD family hydrolase [Spirochaetes bacterium]|nr:HAD family hydrolase [Spirochaetota bacterium]